jgi:transcriptional regulator with XRE-family HTH domain
MTQQAFLQPAIFARAPADRPIWSTGAADYTSTVSFAQPSPSSQELATLYVVAFVELGTGGFPTVDWSRAYARTGPFTIVREGEVPAEALTTADRVLLLRRWFSLSVAETARVLGVQRPTIYSWQEGKTPATAKNLERLRVIFDLAREWRQMSSDPVGHQRKEPLGPGGCTLVDLLSRDEIVRARVTETMRRISEKMERDRAQRPASGAELAKRLGFKPLSEVEATENVVRESARASRKTGGT